MLAARVVGPGRLEVDDVPSPEIAQGQVRVRSHRASICGSDVHVVYDGFFSGPYPGPPGFPGHEGVGWVVESRSPGIADGEWVLTAPVPRLARCFAEEQVLGGGSVVRLPGGETADRLLMAQQLGTVLFAFRRHWPAELSGEGRTAAIIGAGSAGLFFLQVARRLAGFSQVVVADLSPLRLGLARELGADVVVQPPGESFVEAVLDHTEGAGADLVVEAAGYDATRVQSLQAVRAGGRVGYFGFPERPGATSTWSFGDAWAKGVTVEVVKGAQAEPGLPAFCRAVELIDSGEVVVDHLLSLAYPLAQVQEAFDAARERRAEKISLTLTG